MFTPAADGSVDLNINYRANTGEGITAVQHKLPKKPIRHGPGTSINLSIGHSSSQRINMVNPHSFMPYHPSGSKYDVAPSNYPVENFPLHERPHIPGASSSGSSSTKYGSVTKYFPVG